MAPPGPRHPHGALRLGDLACHGDLSPLADLSNSGVRRQPHAPGQRLGWAWAVMPRMGELGREVSRLWRAPGTAARGAHTQISIFLLVVCLLLWSDPWSRGWRREKGR